MNIYITGVAGLVGSNLAKRLLTTTDHSIKGCDTLIGCLLYTSPSPRDQRGSGLGGGGV